MLNKHTHTHTHTVSYTLSFAIDRRREKRQNRKWSQREKELGKGGKKWYKAGFCPVFIQFMCTTLYRSKWMMQNYTGISNGFFSYSIESCIHLILFRIFWLLYYIGFNSFLFLSFFLLLLLLLNWNEKETRLHFEYVFLDSFQRTFDIDISNEYKSSF